EAQVRAAAGRLAAEPPFEMVATSDLCRALRTAELLAGELGLGGGLAIDPGLREYDVAQWSGLTYEQIEAGWPGELERFRRGEVSPPDGEDRFEFDARVAAAGRRVGMLAAKAGGARLLVIAHGGVVRALARAAGSAEHRVGHLAGYWGLHDARGLCPDRPVDLLSACEPA
ncbi:MAG: histidine phosphatase family protein, partial [Acidimicrobiales bacterium]